MNMICRRKRLDAAMQYACSFIDSCSLGVGCICICVCVCV